MMMKVSGCFRQRQPTGPSAHYTLKFSKNRMPEGSLRKSPFSLALGGTSTLAVCQMLCSVLCVMVLGRKVFTCFQLETPRQAMRSSLHTLCNSLCNVSVGAHSRHL